MAQGIIRPSRFWIDFLVHAEGGHAMALANRGDRRGRSTTAKHQYRPGNAQEVVNFHDGLVVWLVMRIFPYC